MPNIEMTNEQIQNTINLLEMVHVEGSKAAVTPVLIAAQELQEFFREVLIKNAVNEPAEKEQE